MGAAPQTISDSMDLCLLAEDPIAAWHREMVAAGKLAPDAEQERLVRLLQGYSTRLAAKLAGSGDAGDWQPAWLSRLLSAGRAPDAEMPAGVYVHGGVGSGKSMLMDAFFLQTPVVHKARAHFHAFMRRLHGDLKALDGAEDPLAAAAAKIAGRFRLICFDEFHVSDIADAMILRRLLELLIADGVHFVMTSNYAPCGLYPNGLARDRFVPAIELIESRFEMHEMRGASDYRLRQLSKGKTYYSPLGKHSEARLREAFGRLAQGIAVRPSVKVNGRQIAAIARTTGAVWLGFDELCASPRSQSDYLELADRFSTVIVSGVPRLDAVGADVSRRFTLLIDVLYDMRVKLICSAAAPLDELYGAAEGGESGRTLSRLREMQSKEYWQAPISHDAMR